MNPVTGSAPVTGASNLRTAPAAPVLKPYVSPGQ